MEAAIEASSRRALLIGTWSIVESIYYDNNGLIIGCQGVGDGEALGMRWRSLAVKVDSAKVGRPTATILEPTLMQVV